MDLVIAGGVAVASLIPIFGLSKDIDSIKVTLKEMNGMPTFSPLELHNLLQDGKEIMKYFKESDGGETLKGKIFVQGRIDAKYPIKSVLTDRDLIYRQFYVNNIYSYDRNQQMIRNQFRKFIPFTSNNNNNVISESSPYMDLYNFQDPSAIRSDYEIKNNMIPRNRLSNFPYNIQAINHTGNDANNVSIRILKNFEANFKYALQIIKIKRHFKKLNLAENIIIIFGYLIEFIFSMLHLRIRGRGIKVGYQEMEFGIPIRSLITIFGELIYHKQTGKMVMKKPEYYFYSDARLKFHLNNKIQNKRVLMVLLCAPLLISSVLQHHI